MAPLICLVTSFLAFLLMGLFVPYFGDWHNALRAALSAMFLLTASAHWGTRRPDLIRMVPAGIGNAGIWVTLTGFAEVALAIGLQIPKLAQWAALAGIVMLCCLFPANLKAAREHMTIRRRPVLPAFPRLLLQLIFIGALVAATWRR
jgi:uncharacterized membrane protein